MADPTPDLFEMRRLESLSNTIFGVAMTLLANDLPKAGEFKAMPTWSDLGQLYSGRLTGLILSFIIAGVFWISHHRRLARQPEAGRHVVLLNLMFLLSIVLLPVTNGLYGNYGMSSAVAVLFGLHLTVIAGLNATLWWLVMRGFRHQLIAALFPLAVFLPGTLVAAVAPQYATYFWFLAFGGLLIRRRMDVAAAGKT
ncbi:TMEM175 family protein [Bradyrhizobium genosp. A]|uniref:TMEM175 family protein n=1 Tax=Bradyrhizobium genosp. A TaxID=83626 RepID=UPI003CE6E3C9